MADFLSDSDDEKAVEDILSQAKDLAVLEQLAAINSSAFTHSVLPSNLEARFQKLKSFPASAAKDPSPNLAQPSGFKKCASTDKRDGLVELDLVEDSTTCLKKCPSENICSSPPKSPSSSSSCGEDLDLSPPVKKSGCFLCSPKQKKKVSSRKKKKRAVGWRNSDELLRDLSKFSLKSKKAMEEEEKKISREAEKIVKWAKQASARMMDVPSCYEEDDDDDAELTGTSSKNNSSKFH